MALSNGDHLEPMLGGAAHVEGVHSQASIETPGSVFTPAPKENDEKTYGRFQWLSDYEHRVKAPILEERYNSYPRVTVTMGICISMVGYLWVYEQLEDETEHLKNLGLPGVGNLSASGGNASLLEVVNETMKRCYVNKQCSYREDVAGSFFGHNANQVLSNLVYIVVGLVLSVAACCVKGNNAKLGYAIHAKGGRGYGLYTAKYRGMYVNACLSLIVEGFLSGLYHVCPTSWNNEFDYIGITMLCASLFLMLWSKRHPLIMSVGSWAIFIGCVFFLCSLAAFDARDNHPRVGNAAWILCSLFYFVFMPRIFMMLHFGLNFITPEPWECALGPKAAWEAVISSMRSERSSHVGSTVYFFLFVWVAGLIWFLLCRFYLRHMLTAAIMKYSVAFLGTYMVFYIVMEIVDHRLRESDRKYGAAGETSAAPNNEGQGGCSQRCLIICVSILTFLCMATGGYFFVHDVYSTTLSWKDSLRKNQPCVLLGLDNHDLWHLFSGVGLGGVIAVSMMFDNLNGTVQHTKLAVF